MRKQKSEHSDLHKKRDSLIQNLFADIPELSFHGNSEIVVEGCRGVLEYSEEVIRINTSIGLICFEGRGLNLRCISPSELIIDGFVTKVEFVL